MTGDNYIDLHLHTTASDGSFSPEQVVKEASELGFKAIAITDHDTIDGLEAGRKAAQTYGIEFIPGVELNTDYQDTEVHVLGYYINEQQSEFVAALEELKAARRRRIKKMVAKLDQLGVEISWSEILHRAGDSALGRAHVAEQIVEKGYAADWETAFKEYIGRSAPGYVAREKLTPKQAIAVIKDAGGIPIIAHPVLIGDDSLLPQFIEWGAAGLEVYHSDHAAEDVARYRKFVEDNNLLMTGGSDCHGPHRKQGVLLGQIKAPYYLLDKMKKKL